MAFELYGRNENYFVNNVWGWHPLWQFACRQCPDVLTPEDLELGSFNMGHCITEQKAKALGERLLHCCESGAAKDYEKKRQERLDSLPDEVCRLCHGTGERHDQHVDGTCNGCRKSGKERASERSYLFHAENVRNFAEFCIASGGFEIW
jgi:hypothetical protein